MRDALQALEQFDDTALEQVARERMSEAQVAQFAELRKAYAALLLKLQSQPVN